MNVNTNKQTVGQAFAFRWLVKEYAGYEGNSRRQRIQPPLPEPEDLSQQIADAVDAYVERKVEELRRKLRAVAVEAADGAEGLTDQVVLGSDEMLQNSALVRVAKCLQTNMDAISKFPVSPRA